MTPSQRDPGVVVGEAVELELVPAKLPTRALAFALDAVLVGLLLVAVVVVVVVAGVEIDPALATALTVVLVVLGLVAWPTAWETTTRGRSPGKAAFGLRVVRDDGGPIRFRHALVRALAGLFVDFGLLSGVVAMVVSACSPRAQRVGDLLAGTIVLRERMPRSTRARDLPPPDPALAGWASSLQLAALPDDLALAARQFLGRTRELDPAVRRSLGERLASDVAARVAPPPPPGVTAEAYLTAVLAERRRRT
ncbi:RDD family protein [Actinomycetospora sp. TBRC 11914]|uniref:RDD family protein n=1 Tax=Actinomycetospora sp. TBRC 11914 TaxID=2729387 RepID=UPI00145C4740|nr:RDD family protein [Actinomycetospora sp. TBRC 11914]NMO92786.1 RDD family protein [Actinomycetospora sp. TBRC 11914]